VSKEKQTRGEREKLERTLEVFETKGRAESRKGTKHGEKGTWVARAGESSQCRPNIGLISAQCQPRYKVPLIRQSSPLLSLSAGQIRLSGGQNSAVIAWFHTAEPQGVETMEPIEGIGVEGAF